MKVSKLLGRVQKVILILPCFCAFVTIHAFSQETEIDYNSYYRFPFSVGVEYQTLTPFADYGNTFNIYEIEAYLRWPVFKTPLFQPTLRVGIMNFDSQDPVDPNEWDHRHYFGTVGVLYSNRFSKTFEFGAEISAGYSQAVFPDLIPGEGAVSSSNLVFELGGRIALNPSYNFSIDLNPNIKYLLSLSDLNDFNGLILGIGFAAHYRFGQDPDSSAALIRSLRFEEVSVQPLFSAMQSYYVNYPIGEVKITNTEKHPIVDLNISFYQAGYMDSPTPSGNIPKLGPGETTVLDLFASFNQEVFTTEGVTPLTGEIIVTYSSKGKPVEQRQAVSYDLHDKTAITWDDDRKAAAFITPADSALRNYTSFIRQTLKDDVVSTYNNQVQVAAQVYEALREIGILYQADPSSPFTMVQGDPMVVDSISLPRDTLKRITGDCDDLTVLYNSLLETVGVETGFITTPGHIYSAFNTKVPSASYKEIHPDRDMTINVDGDLWVLVEITMIGKTNFINSWRKGTEEWHMYDNKPEKRGFYFTRSSQELYRSVGLKETDLGLQYGNKENIIQWYRDDMGELIDLIVQDYSKAAQKSRKKGDYNKLGIAYAKFAQYERAEQAFGSALQIDPEYANAMANLGNVAFLKGDYQGALFHFHNAYELLKSKGKGNSKLAIKILLNIFMTHNELKQYDEAKEYYETAFRLNASEAEKYANIAAAGSEHARAAEDIDTEKQLIFLDEEE